MMFVNLQDIAVKMDDIAKETSKNEYFVLNYAKISFVFICHP